MGVKILFFLVEPLVKILCSLKRGSKFYIFSQCLEKGGQNRGAYQPTSLKGCPPPPRALSWANLDISAGSRCKKCVMLAPCLALYEQISLPVAGLCTVTFFPVTFYPTCPLFLFFLSLYSYCYPNELFPFFLFLFFPLVHCYYLSCYFFSYLKLLLSFLFLFFPLVHCYFLSCYFFFLLLFFLPETVTFFPVTFFPVTFFPCTVRKQVKATLARGS